MGSIKYFIDLYDSNSFFKYGFNSNDASIFLSFLQKQVLSGYHIFIDSVRISKYNVTISSKTLIQISSRNDNGVILFITDDNWHLYNYYQTQYTNIVFIGPVINIGNQWLSGSRLLSSVYFCLPKLVSIGSSMLFGCENINYIDFTGLHTLQQIGKDMTDDNFMNNTRTNNSTILFNYNNVIVNNSKWCYAYGLKPVEFTGTGELKYSNKEWIFTSSDKCLKIPFLFFTDEYIDWKIEKENELLLNNKINIINGSILVNSLSYVKNDFLETLESNDEYNIVITSPITYYKSTFYKAYVFDGNLYEDVIEVRI